jgi:hypothetical protein
MEDPYVSVVTWLQSSGIDVKQEKPPPCVRCGYNKEPNHEHSYEEPDSKGVTGSMRASVLDEAKELVTGDRNNHYGPPHQDFARTAGALTALGYRGPDGRNLEAHDVAIMVGMVKMSRLMWTPRKRDSWVDLAGYAACGYEAAEMETHDAD